MANKAKHGGFKLSGEVTPNVFHQAVGDSRIEPPVEGEAPEITEENAPELFGLLAQAFRRYKKGEVERMP
jgi:hypothetical protein